MPEKNAEEFPFEKAGSFEAPKKALEAKEAAKEDSEKETDKKDVTITPDEDDQSTPAEDNQHPDDEA